MGWNDRGDDGGYRGGYRGGISGWTARGRRELALTVLGGMVLVGGCGPSTSSPPIEGGGGSGDSGTSSDDLEGATQSETSFETADASDTGGSSSGGDEGPSTTGGTPSCAFDPIDGAAATITAGLRRSDDRMVVQLASSVSRECGNNLCGGWQARIIFDQPGPGPFALGTEVSVTREAAYSSCRPDVPGEVCDGCTEDDYESTDDETPWTGTVEVVSDGDGCVQLRFVDSDLLRYNGDPKAPMNFGVNASDCL